MINQFKRGLMPAIVFFAVFMSAAVGGVSLAQDATPEATPVIVVTPAPVETPAPVDTHTSDINAILEALKEFALIVAVVVLAFKTGSLIPASTVDNVLMRGFDLAQGLADKTPTTIDNQVLELAKPILLKFIEDELSKRNPPTASVN